MTIDEREQRRSSTFAAVRVFMVTDGDVSHLDPRIRMPAWTPVHLSPELPPPKGPYSPAVRAGDFVYVSGQVPRDPRTGELAGDDVATQTRQTLSNLQRVLEQAGATLADVVSVTVYLARADDWGAMNEVYAKVFHQPFPSRTTVGAELRGILVEISAVAYLPGRS